MNVPVDCAGEDHNPKGRIPRRDGAEEGPARVGDSCRIAAQRDCRHLLGEEHVLARQVGRALCAPGALAGVAARRRSGAAGVCRHSRRHDHAKAIASCRRDRCRSIGPSDYASTLAQGFGGGRARAEREQRIRKALDAATRTIPGARWREDKSLLDTVVNLTEFPSVVLGNFDPEFLSLADEVLVTVMRDHQKYFALEDASGKLLPHFLAVLNTDGDPDGLIRHGNERVLRARFNDARFFWQTDQKIPLRERVDMLKSVTFQKDLGSYFDKTMRVQKLGSLISEAIRSAGGAGTAGRRLQGGAAVPRPTSPPSW